MGQATRTTKLPLDLGKRRQGRANTAKRAYLEATVWVLDAARAFYVAFFLAHPEKVTERVPYFSWPHQEMRTRLIAADKLLTWAEYHTVETSEHPHPLPDWNFSQAFPDLPFVYRRAIIKDAIGKVRSYLSNLSNWRASGQKKGKPGLPGSSNHPTLYEGTFSLSLEASDVEPRFEQFCERHGTEITVMNGETFSPEEELVRDLIAIVTVFSARLHGLRSYKNLIRAAALGKEVTDDQGTQDQTPSHA